MHYISSHTETTVKTSYHILPPWLYSSSWFPFSDAYLQTTKIPCSLHQLKHQSSQIKMFQIPAMMKLNSPHPVFPHYLVPLLQHLSVTKAQPLTYSSARKPSLWASHTQRRSFHYHKLIMLTLLRDSLQWKLKVFNWPFPCSSRAIP